MRAEAELISAAHFNSREWRPPPAAGTQNKRQLLSQLPFILEGEVKIDIFSFEPVTINATQPAFWPAALLRRASVLPQAKPRRRRNSPHSRWRLCRLTDVAYPLRVLPPSIEIPKGGADQRSAKPKKKDTLKACLSFWYARLDSNQRPTESESVTLSS